jgi:hypothetical protein
MAANATPPLHLLWITQHCQVTSVSSRIALKIVTHEWNKWATFNVLMVRVSILIFKIWGTSLCEHPSYVLRKTSEADTIAIKV